MARVTALSPASTRVYPREPSPCPHPTETAGSLQPRGPLMLAAGILSGSTGPDGRPQSDVLAGPCPDIHAHVCVHACVTRRPHNCRARGCFSLDGVSWGSFHTHAETPTLFPAARGSTARLPYLRGEGGPRPSTTVTLGVGQPCPCSHTQPGRALGPMLDGRGRSEMSSGFLASNLPGPTPDGICAEALRD